MDGESDTGLLKSLFSSAHPRTSSVATMGGVPSPTETTERGRRGSARTHACAVSRSGPGHEIVWPPAEPSAHPCTPFRTRACVHTRPPYCCGTRRLRPATRGSPGPARTTWTGENRFRNGIRSSADSSARPARASACGSAQSSISISTCCATAAPTSGRILSAGGFSGDHPAPTPAAIPDGATSPDNPRRCVDCPSRRLTDGFRNRAAGVRSPEHLCDVGEGRGKRRQ